MSKILLDYFFPITAIEPTPQASTAFLKQVLLVVKPKEGATENTIALLTAMSGVTPYTDNTEAQQLFNAGLTRLYIVAVDSLDLDTILEGHESDFFTILISSDFSDAEITAADFGAFEGVVGVSSTDDAFLAVQAVIPKRAAFHTTSGNKAKNMVYAFGKLLSGAYWRNQQYITMPFADDVDTLGEANNLFDDKISFVISDSEFGNRLALFAAGQEAIVKEYIQKNLQIDMQSKALTYISANQPAYTKKNAALLEDELQKVVQLYIDAQSIESGDVEIELINENWTASGEVLIAKPKALWRIVAEMRQT